MKPAAWAAIALAIVLASVLTACVRTSEGTPVAGDAAPLASRAPSTRAIPTPETDLTTPGVVPTTRTPVPADTVTCTVPNPPPVGVVASVSDPAAPKITVALPTGWSTSKGDGDVGARLEGPDGLSATVTIAETPLDPAAAFEKYADDAMATSAVSSISVLPADLCGYSGQKLLGAWSDSPQQALKFGDRIAHIWTNTANYLVAVHVEGPASVAGFDPMGSPLMEDFAIVVP
ncbi:MAG: hypothetical protein QOD39_1254 [Mycobacterium sp.]|jgi:hypothetical protein|nr:hypothetical protein [Mycobacterium sp.]